MADCTDQFPEQLRAITEKAEQLKNGEAAGLLQEYLDEVTAKPGGVDATAPTYHSPRKLQQQHLKEGSTKTELHISASLNDNPSPHHMEIWLTTGGTKEPDFLGL
jgi:hypothetical protein